MHAGDGTIPVIMEDRLVEIGNWLRVNGDAIFDTVPSVRSCQYTQGVLPLRDMGLAHSFQVAYRVMDLIGHQPRNGIASIEMFFTAKKNDQGTDLYAITAGYPLGKLLIRDVEIRPSTQVHMLGLPEELMFEYDGSDLEIQVPLVHPTLLPCNHAFSFHVSHAFLKDHTSEQRHSIYSDL